MLSRVLGFVRDMAMAWLLGSSLAADALVMALRLPHVLRRLLGEGTLSMSLTADFVRGEQGHSERVTMTRPPSLTQELPMELPLASPHAVDLRLALAHAVGFRLALILGVAVLLGEILAYPLAMLLAPGQAQDTQLLDSAVPLLRLCLPYAFTAGMAALGMALLHSMGRFLLPALMPALFNITVLAFAALAALDVAPAAWLLALGVCCGGVAQWLVQVVALRLYLPARTTPPVSCVSSAETNQAAWNCLARLPGTVLGAAAPQLAMLGGMMVASWLPQGSVAALYYAERLLELPLGVAGAALGVAALPALSRLAASEKHEEFARTASHALRLSLCVTLPATAGLLAVSMPLVQTLFARGAFDHNAVQATVLALVGYALGLPAYGLTRPLLAACQARRCVRACAISGLVTVATTVVASVALIIVLPAHLEHLALLAPPLGVSLGLWVQTALLIRAINAGLAVKVRIAWRSLGQQGLAALGTGGAAWAVTQTPLPAWLHLTLAVPVGATVYILLLWVLDNAELRDIVERRKKQE